MTTAAPMTTTVTTGTTDEDNKDGVLREAALRYGRVDPCEGYRYSQQRKGYCTVPVRTTV